MEFYLFFYNKKTKKKMFFRHLSLDLSLLAKQLFYIMLWQNA
jgi:hypothetical protein